MFRLCLEFSKINDKVLISVIGGEDWSINNCLQVILRSEFEFLSQTSIDCRAPAAEDQDFRRVQDGFDFLSISFSLAVVAFHGGDRFKRVICHQAVALLLIQD